MKVLFDNALLDASLSAVNESPNYPASNLAHQILKKRYQSVASSDTIVAEWAAAIIVNCIYLGYTNAETIEVRLYDAADALLDTIAVLPADLVVHFTAISGVRRMEVDVEVTVGSVYVGGIGIGKEYTMPDPRNDWTDALLDNSTVETSLDGQVFANRIEPLRQIPLNFFAIGFEAYRALRDLISPVSRSVPVWLDAFENWHEEVMPLYGVMELGKVAKNDHVLDFTLNVTEAR
ncbi:MAG: hypothetical protein PHS14_07960 [Elusimicrobia bacterium]|nr:hypothetical protein [Elusimicrobiota bacterium]